MRVVQVCVALMIGILPTGSIAQDVTVLSDNALLGQVEAETLQGDASGLLSVMLEVKRRGLLMFADSRERCDAVVPRLGLLGNMMSFGNARRAYIVAARRSAMAEGSCGCIFASLSFEQFARELVGDDGSSLSGDDLDAMRAFRREHEDEVDAQYRVHRRELCGKP